MKPYQINELERLTGIKAHTIRIWEKRYGLITPLRTSTNRRYYSDDEVRKLLNVSTLLSKGHKISKIACLTEIEFTNELLAENSLLKSNNSYEGLINDLLKSMLNFDEQSLESIFQLSVTRHGFYNTMLHVVYPFLNKVGMLWRIDEAETAQEHFATAVIRRKLQAATEALPKAINKGNKFLLFLPEGEWHDTGLLFADYVIRSKQHESVYLGQNLNQESLLKVLQVVKPDYLLLFYITARPIEEIRKQLLLFAGHNEITVLVTGTPSLISNLDLGVSNVVCLSSVNDLFDYL